MQTCLFGNSYIGNLHQNNLDRLREDDKHY